MFYSDNTNIFRWYIKAAFLMSLVRGIEASASTQYISTLGYEAKVAEGNWYIDKFPETREGEVKFVDKKGEKGKAIQVVHTTDGTDYIVGNRFLIPWNYKTFGENHREVGEALIGHKYRSEKDARLDQNRKGTGVQRYPIKTLITDFSDTIEDHDVIDVIIVTEGCRCMLGASDEVKDYLESLKKQGSIRAYEIMNSRKAKERHNTLVAQGKLVYTLLHTTC
jgi:hypothetical protein